MSTTEAVSEEVEQQEEATTSESQEIDSPSGDSPAEPKKSGVQKRIDELTRDKYEARREAEKWQQIAMQNAQKPAEEPQTHVPSPEGYEEYEDYLVAKAKHELREEQRAIEEKTRAAQAREEFQRKVMDFQRNARAKFDDFDHVFNAYVPMSEAMENAVLGSEKSADIAYYLGKNLDEADRISKLDPYSAGREIGKIEAHLSLPSSPQTTTAPPPIEPVGGGDATKKAPADMSTEEWMAWRWKQLQR